MDRDAWRLPRDALIEFVFRYRLGLWVERTRGCVRQHRPQRWPARLRQTGWGGRLPQMTEDLPYRHRCGDEADDAHFATAPRTQQGQHFIDAGEQQRPGVAGRLAVQRLGYDRTAAGGGIPEGAVATAATVSAPAGCASAVTAARSGEFGARTP